MEIRDHKHGKLKYFEIYARQHCTCVNFAEMAGMGKKIRRTLTNDMSFSELVMVVVREDAAPS